MNTLFASFQPTEDVVAILSSLRQAGLSWIAEEIETTIRNGHSVTKTRQVADYDEHKIIPFDKDEQLRITLRTIQRYMVELHKAWFWARDDLRETLENPNLQISIAYLGSGRTPLTGGVRKD